MLVYSKGVHISLLFYSLSLPPERLWGPLSLLLNGCCGLLRTKTAGTSSQSDILVPRVKMRENLPQLSLYTFEVLSPTSNFTFISKWPVYHKQDYRRKGRIEVRLVACCQIFRADLPPLTVFANHRKMSVTRAYGTK